MGSNSPEGTRSGNTLSPSTRSEILYSLVPTALHLVNAQFDAFSARLADALLAMSEQIADAKEANLGFNAGNLLKNNGYAFYHLASARLEQALRDAIRAIDQPAKLELAKYDRVLSLVSYEEMEDKVLLGRVSRLFELEQAEQLTALNTRLAYLTERDTLSVAQNPFRPEVFLAASNAAWCEFDPDPESHHLILPLLRTEVFLELKPILQSLNDELIARGILPQLVESYRVRKTEDNSGASKKEEAGDSVLFQQLKRFFSAAENPPQQGSSPLQQAHQQQALQGSSPDQAFAPTAATTQLFGYLAGLQKRVAERDLAGASGAQSALQLSQIKEQMPHGAITRIDENTIDLLTKIFDAVFQDQNIPGEIKELIGFLQIPVLKAALLDREFFFKEAHPARRLIELLAKSSMAWDQEVGQDDPLYQTMKRNVDRVHQEFDQEITLFSDVVAELESFIKAEEKASSGALAAPITQALKQEKLREATKSATDEVAMRVGTGEVVTFVETFLESKWVPILTLAYSVKDEKPQVLQNAIKTMDDLIWSIKPKVTAEQRKELIAKLPALLAMLNKWLNVIKWDDADRLQFFADLAECHASIVRAPLELSPHRQMEIALEVAQKAAERRLEIRANQQAAPVADEFVHAIERLERGNWLEFTHKNGDQQKVKLAWVSPLRSLYIFTTNQKEEAFSMSVEELAQTFREGRAQRVVLDRLVDRALAKALGSDAVNDDRSVAASEPSSGPLSHSSS